MQLTINIDETQLKEVMEEQLKALDPEVLQGIFVQVEIPDDNSIIKWKMNDDDEWKTVEIIDLINTYVGRPRGRWILVHPLQENDEGAYMCSVCRTGDWCISPEFKFCPYCGAAMDGGNAE